MNVKIESGRSMKDDMKNSIFASAINGVIYSSKISELGIRRSALTELVEAGELIRCSRGVYMPADEWEDDYYLLQKRYSQGIFSHGTALYLLGFSERVPLTFHMSFPHNYNSTSLKNENVIVTRVVAKNYELGASSTKTPSGNEVRLYDVERCLCDIVKGKEQDLQLVQYAMRKYVSSKDKDVNKLMKYASQLRVEKKIRRYMEVLL